ncbi:MAG: cation:proton antiporter [Planctomycetota bacterium]
MHGLLSDIGIAVIAATILGLIAHLTRQPIILAYLLAGVAIGPLGFEFVHERANIEVISELGMILLLFVIGLEMDLSQVAKSGRQLLLAGFGQFPIGVLLGVGLFWLLGYGMGGGDATGLYLALACSLSSTAIVVKLLYDTRCLDTISGRITIGILVVQDIFAILVLALQPNLTNPSLWPIVKALIGSVALAAMGLAMARFVLGAMFRSLSNNPEMVVAAAIGWCAACAGAAGALGLSTAMGALIAGLAIGSMPYRLHVTAKVLPLRDFFLTLFFVSLGMQVVAPEAGAWTAIIIAVVFTIGSRFVTVWPLLRLGGAGNRTGFIASLNLAQVSEFSLVIAALGVQYGHIGAGAFNIVLYAMAITAVLSSYGIRWGDAIWRTLSRVAPDNERENAASAERHPVVILGIHRSAQALIDDIATNTPDLLARILVIDFNLETLKSLRARGVAGHFGDLASMDTLHHAHVEHARVILSTIPDMMLKGVDNLGLVRTCRTLAPEATIIATAESAEQARILREAGANEALMPWQLYGNHLAGLVVERERLTG